MKKNIEYEFWVMLVDGQVITWKGVSMRMAECLEKWTREYGIYTNIKDCGWSKPN